MAEEKGEGIILKTTNFQDSSRILSLFTPHAGIISLIVKSISKKNPSLLNLTTPLCRAEFVYYKGTSSLYRFIDAALIDLYLPLRTSYSHLNTAGKMLKEIFQSQLPAKPAAPLYHLLLTYLKKLPLFPHPETLYVSFQLKLLKYEGLISIAKGCNRCKTGLASMVCEREGVCSSCAPKGSASFSPENWTALLLLLHSRSFAPLLSIKLNPTLQKAIALCLQIH